MHATPITGGTSSALCILEHHRPPNHHAAVKGMQVVQNTLARHRRNCTWR